MSDSVAEVKIRIAKIFKNLGNGCEDRVVPRHASGVSLCLGLNLVEWTQLIRNGYHADEAPEIFRQPQDLLYFAVLFAMILVEVLVVTVAIPPTENAPNRYSESRDPKQSCAGLCFVHPTGLVN